MIAALVILAVPVTAVVVVICCCSASGRADDRIDAMSREREGDLPLREVRLADIAHPYDEIGADCVASWPEYRAVLAVERLLAETAPDVRGKAA